MLDEQDIYISFRTIQCDILNRKFNVPKNWDDFFNNKLKPEQREVLRKMVRYLATTWSNVDVDKYFKYGFELWKTFSYHQFFNTQLINYYIQKEKNKKIKNDNTKKALIESAKFVRKFIIDNKLLNLEEYCNIKNGFQSLAVKHYVEGNLSQHFIGYLIYIKYVDINEEKLNDIYEKWDVIRNEIISILDFLNEINRKLS